MAVKLLFNDLPQYLDGNGDPYAGAQLFTYAAGSSTKQTTYQDSAGSTPHANPIELDANGRVPAPVWGTVGQTYKLVLAPSDDTDPPTSPIFTIDNVAPINDTTVTVDEWVASGLTPTYVSSTQFTLVGDQTTKFHVGRRLKITDSGGTKYCTITVSAFTTLTTVTVTGDALATPTSAVSYALLKTDNPSVPVLKDTDFLISGSSDKTKKIRFEVDGVTTATTRVLTVPDADGTLITSTNPFPDSSAVVAGATDATKKVRIEADGLTTATTRVWTAPDKDITVAGIGDFTAANGASWVLLSRTAASGASTVDFTSGLSSTYDNYVVVINAVVPSTDATNLLLRTSADGGSSFDAGASDYSVVRWAASTSVAFASATGSGQSSIQLNTSSLGSNSGETFSAVLYFDLGSASRRPQFHWVASQYDSTPAFAHITGAACKNAAAVINAIRFQMSSGNINGNFALYGIRVA